MQLLRFPAPRLAHQRHHLRPPGRHLSRSYAGCSSDDAIARAIDRAADRRQLDAALSAVGLAQALNAGGAARRSEARGQR
jgi:hypothetical protein